MADAALPSMISEPTRHAATGAGLVCWRQARGKNCAPRGDTVACTDAVRCARALARPRPWRLAMSALLYLVVAQAGAQPAVQPYQIEAVFLFNFTQFVSWPPGAFADAHAPIVICVLGEDPFGTYLDDTVRGEHIDERPLVVRRYRRVEELGPCHVLFVGRDQAAQLQLVLAAVRGHPVLTVADIDGFGAVGGMVRFVVENRHVRLRINIAAARAENLAISAKLLRIAAIVPEP